MTELEQLKFWKDKKIEAEAHLKALLMPEGLRKKPVDKRNR